AALGGRPSDIFVAFGPSVAAASIAQVHRAEIAALGGPRPVAVKVLRPGVDRRFQADLESFAFVARTAEKLSAEARRLRLAAVVGTPRRSVSLPMPLRPAAPPP